MTASWLLVNWHVLILISSMLDLLSPEFQVR